MSKQQDNPSEDRPDQEAESPPGSPESLVPVGLGASAGGLNALRQFFKHLPEDPGIPFVVVMHLSSEHESHLAELLQPHSPLPVQQVTETTPLGPNRVYVIPPGANLEAIDTHLRLSAPAHRAPKRPVDHFFSTLSESHDGNSIGIILTGMGSDGTLGLRRIKEAGGVTVAQDPDQAEFDGMPRSAITTGMVDLVLPIERIAQEVVRLARVRPDVPLADDHEDLPEDQSRVLQKIFTHVRARTGHDFSQYKRSTIMRRIRRRMQLEHAETLERYLDFLREGPDEAHDLFDDLLITVTEFFRDRHVFERLENKVIPELFEGKTSGDQVRVWSVGCSTGEEAYSLAMLLLEEAGRRDERPTLQVFASDLHERSLATAREGVYPAEIADDVSPERLKRFFTQEGGHYRIRRDVRETVVFAPHDLLSDPPFCHMDLIVCRNVLIYLQRDVQQDVIRLFHHALKPDGRLVLGASETVDRSELFILDDKPGCVFRRRNVPTREPGLPIFPTPPGPRGERGAGGGGHAHDRRGTRRGAADSYGVLHERVVERYAPPSVLINSDHEIVHSSARAGRYLLNPGGEPTRQVFKLLREPLGVEVRAALVAARRTGGALRSRPVEVRFNGESALVAVYVHPAREPDLEGFALVVFEEVPGHAPGAEPEEDESSGAPGSTTHRELKAEIELYQQRLQATIEEYESSREEMQASNEELQSANEELRSTMEELETSKEELQSTNEELTTVSQENRHRVEELTQLSNDLKNLLASSETATLFLDRELRIVRFTPAVGELFNIRLSDRGRPLTDLTHHLGYDDLSTDAGRVLDRLERVEREIPGPDGRWYLTRLLPYRDGDDRVQGVVVTFIDITDRKQAERTLQEAHDQLEHRVQERTRELMEQRSRLRDLARELVSAEQRERKRLAALLHDELQQYLVALKMHLNKARRHAPPTDLAQTLQTCTELIDEALASSRTLTHELRPPALYEGGLPAALRWLGDDMARRHDMNVTVDTDTVETPLRQDIRVMLFEGVRELLFNVVKHARVKEARVVARETDGTLSISVQDGGVGFDAEEIVRRKHGGSGLGLFSIRERLESLGGEMDVRSIVGDGAQVTITLPLRIAAERETPEPEPAPRPAARAIERAEGSAPHVLIVDDHSMLREGLVHLIGHDERLVVVGQASDGTEALDLVDELQPDVVLMDVNMPRVNGIEATRRIRERWPGVQVVGLSVQDDPTTRQAMLDAGAAAFVSKSEDAEFMVQAILSAVGRA